MHDEKYQPGDKYQLDQSTDTYHKVKARFCKKLLDELLPSLNAGDMVVEIGPGQGHFALACQAKRMGYIGLEPSKVFREELREKGINVKAAWVPPIPMEDESCDLVYACTVLEHFPTYVEVSHFVNEVCRILKNQKYLCVVVPNYLTVKSFFFDMDYSHSYVTTRTKLLRLFEHAGLQVVDIQHVIGFFWVRSHFFHHIIRHTINIVMVPIYWGFITWMFEYLGQGQLLWKIRKTLYEHIIIIAKKT